MITKDEVERRIQQYTNEIKVVSLADKVTQPSEFFNARLGKTFRKPVAGLIMALRKGTPVHVVGSGTGTRREKQPPRWQEYAARLKETGFSNVSQLPEIKAKKAATCLAEYGVSTNLKDTATKQAIKQTNLVKYGHECSLHGGSGLQKKLESWAKYEGAQPLKDPKVIAKRRKTRIERGLTKQLQGKTMTEWAKELGVSYSAFQATVKYQGIEQAKLLNASKSILESLISSWFSVKSYNRKLTGSDYRPDFLWEDKKLIVEVDGLYWHSDDVKENDYHVTKKSVYQSLGYQSLFFRSDELFERPDVVKSIIKHKLGDSTTVFARKCVVSPIDIDFFDTNHLMGKGRGCAVGLFLDGKPVAGMQCSWKNKAKKVLEISRFCTAMGYSVTGGYTKLLSYFEKKFSPQEVITFSDLRYGHPQYLIKLGFKHVRTQPSFRWTNGKTSVHRMVHRGNTGYDQGLFKIWDCGQALYTKGLLSSSF